MYTIGDAWLVAGRRVGVIIALIGLMGAVWGANADFDEELSQDFGMCVVGRTVVIPMPIRNTQDITWTSIVLRPSCTCTGFDDTSKLSLKAGETISIPIKFKAQSQIQDGTIEALGESFIFIDLSDATGKTRRIKQKITYTLIRPFRFLGEGNALIFRSNDQIITKDVGIEIHDQFANCEVTFDLLQKGSVFDCKRKSEVEKGKARAYHVGCARKSGLFGKVVGTLVFSLHSETLSAPYTSSIDVILEDPHPNVTLSRKSLVFGVIRSGDKPELSMWYKLKDNHPGIVKANPSGPFIQYRISPETSEITVSLDTTVMTEEDTKREWFIDLEVEGGDMIRVPCLGKLVK